MASLELLHSSLTAPAHFSLETAVSALQALINYDDDDDTGLSCLGVFNLSAFHTIT